MPKFQRATSTYVGVLIVWTFIKSIFSASGVVDSVTKGIDSAIFTDQEKKELHLKMLPHYEAFKLAQRVIAFLFCGLFAFSFLFYILLITFHVELEASNIIDAVKEFYLGEITLTIVAFYFGGGTIAELKRGKKKI
jgi:hypothetical protein